MSAMPISGRATMLASLTLFYTMLCFPAVRVFLPQGPLPSFPHHFFTKPQQNSILCWISEDESRPAAAHGSRHGSIFYWADQNHIHANHSVATCDSIAAIMNPPYPIISNRSVSPSACECQSAALASGVGFDNKLFTAGVSMMGMGAALETVADHHKQVRDESGCHSQRVGFGKSG